MTEKEPVVRDDLDERAILEVVNREVGVIGAVGFGVIVFARLEMVGAQLFEQVEMMDVHLGPLRQLMAAQIAVDPLDRDARVSDRGGEQIGRDHVAAGEMALLSDQAIVPVGVHQAAAVVECLEAGEIAGLAGGADDEGAEGFGELPLNVGRGFLLHGAANLADEHHQVGLRVLLV